MFKKIFLIIFAVSALAIIIGLFVASISPRPQLPEAEQQRISRIHYIKDNFPSLIAFDPAGRLWVYSSDDVLDKNGTLVVYEEGKETARYDSRDTPLLARLPSTTSHIAFHNQTVWIGLGGNDGGLAVFDGSTWTTFSSDLPTNWVTALNVDNQGRAWVGFYEHGLGIYEKGEWQFFTTQNSGLSVNTIEDIAFDEQGRGWLATDRGGVNIFDGVDWIVLNTENSDLTHDMVNAIVFDERGRAWMDTWQDISVYDEATNTWLHYPIEHDVRSMIFFDATGRLWAIRGLEIHVFDGKTWKRYRGLSPVYGAMPGSNGDILMHDEAGFYLVNAEDVDYNIQVADHFLPELGRWVQVKYFVDSGGLFVLTIFLVLIGLAAWLDAWWTVLVALLLSVPVYLVWAMLFVESSETEGLFLTGGYVWNPGVYLGLAILGGGILGSRLKRSERKRAEGVGLLIGVLLGTVMSCVGTGLAFLLMAK